MCSSPWSVASSAVFLWLAVRDADLSAVRDALEEARIELVLLAVVVLGCGYALQAARWQRIANTPHPSFRRFYGMVLSGLACNNVLPVRVGELLRAGWLSREAPMSGGRALGSVALDRACDVVTLTLFLVIGLQAVASTEWLVRLAIGALIAVVVIALALIGARLYTARRARDRRGRSRVRRLIRDTVEMLAEPVGRRRIAVWMGLSIATWTLGTARCDPRGSFHRNRIHTHRRRIRSFHAKPGCGDSVIAGVRRDVPVARRRIARPPRRAPRGGARVHDPHAGELVHPYHAGRRRDPGDPCASTRSGPCDLMPHRRALGLKTPTWEADTLRA